MRLRDTAAAGLVAGSVWLAVDIAVEPASRSPGLAGWALGGVLGALQLAGRRRPVTVLALSAAAVVAYHLAGYPAIGLGWPLLVPYARAATAGRLLPAALVAVLISVGDVGWRTGVEGEAALPVLVGEAQTLIVVGLALAVGEAAWQRRRWAGEVRDRLARAAEENRRVAAQRMTEQRLAVAADLHDVAAHSLVVIGLQLRIAEETVTVDPPACRAAVAAALAAHDEALRETTRTVRLLRGGSDEDGVAPLAPAPGLADLDRLRAVAGAAGVELEVRVTPGSELTGSVALAVYRICQEALTNTIRHSGARRARLLVENAGDGVHLRFDDDGRPGALPAQGGHGLAGMSDRARSVGGRLRAGPGPERGFLVEAWLPAEPRVSR
ncbi:sensor histidine kinase [Micromonospora sp. CPCC 205556]|uniref:sensor histidine kinase n=1 Tax=Micromonospora sp. CPCC 205556 TaxID=3122398 RepID=UPI002FEEE675